MRDWRLPEHRCEAFLRFYSFHLKYRTHPGCVYFLLPELVSYIGDGPGARAWTVWLNGNTQNPVTTQLLLEASNGDPEQWEAAVRFWNDHFTDLEWDTDRRHQKGKFGEATQKWAQRLVLGDPADEWEFNGLLGWENTWRYANLQPYMGRLSAWSMTEYAKILIPGVPDAATLMLRDWSGSNSHRNGLALIAGNDSVYWGPRDTPEDLVPQLEALGESLRQEARDRNPGNPDVGYLTLESALCTYKSWHKPNRRYPNVYADMHYNRVKRAEGKFGTRFGVQWDARARHLPDYLLLEKSPGDPGLTARKQNHYLETGEPIMMHREWPDMANSFNDEIELI